MNLLEKIQALAEVRGTSIRRIERECDIGNATIRKWDVKTPTLESAKKVARNLQISLDCLVSDDEITISPLAWPSITPAENKILESVKHLSENEKEHLASVVPFVLAIQTGQPPKLPAQSSNILPLPKKEAPAAPEQTVGVSVFDMPASAGTGLYLDSEDYTLVEFPENVVPRQTSFAVRLRGDSMMPDFEDGDIVFVKRQPSLEFGDIGIFCLDNNAYCKRLVEKSGESYLVSLNKKYPPIEIKEYDNLRVLGQVLGRTSGDFYAVFDGVIYLILQNCF